MTAAAFFIGLGYLSPSILYDNHLPVVSFVQALLIRQLQEGKKGNIIKMSECLRTYGPQIIRVPQLQIED